jgi:tetratricopeptide (TPR) repeat protein
MKKAGRKKLRSQGTSQNSAARKAVSKQQRSPHGKNKPPQKSAGKGNLSKARSVQSPAAKTAAGKALRGKVAAAPPAPLVRRKLTPEEIEYRKHVAEFEGGVKLFNQGEFGKAREVFEKLTRVPAGDLAQRSRVYLTICHQRLSRPALRLKTADDYYNYAVSMANHGNQEEAEIQLNKALKLAPKSDYIYYALATTNALRDNVEGSLENLQKAIQLNERNRYLAQNDPDFASLGEDPRFTELIYPEKPVS